MLSHHLNTGIIKNIKYYLCWIALGQHFAQIFGVMQFLKNKMALQYLKKDNISLDTNLLKKLQLSVSI